MGLNRGIIHFQKPKKIFEKLPMMFHLENNVTSVRALKNELIGSLQRKKLHLENGVDNAMLSLLKHEISCETDVQRHDFIIQLVNFVI